jgi:hypothetical protein
LIDGHEHGILIREATQSSSELLGKHLVVLNGQRAAVVKQVGLPGCIRTKIVNERSQAIVIHLVGGASLGAVCLHVAQRQLGVRDDRTHALREGGKLCGARVIKVQRVQQIVLVALNVTF